MQTHLYLIRHGQSEGNLRRSFLGHTDLPLTPLGHEQAEATAVYLDAVAADVIYASDLKRAYQTAEHTARRKGMTPRATPSLREIYAGAWEGELFDTLVERYPESYGIWRNDIGHACPDGGESVAALQERIVAAVKELAARHEGKTLLLFTHATPIRALAAYAMGKSLSEMKEVPWAGNASVSHFTVTDGALSLVAYSTEDFLHGIGTALPKNV